VLATILLVEDDHDAARTLSRALESSGYGVSVVHTGADARSALAQRHPDLILLDLTLPDTDGLVLTSTIKTVTNAPIIICSGRQEHWDRVLGLKLGADDFVAKPFDLDELEARIEAVLRRATRVPARPEAPPDQIHLGDLLIWQSRGMVLLDGRQVHLTPIEYRLLVTLASRRNELVSRETLGDVVWGYQDMGTGHLINVHMGRLRLKLRHASRSAPTIATVRGKGYTISPNSLAQGAEVQRGEPRSSGISTGW
jgi:two-component system response regulator MtrA